MTEEIGGERERTEGDERDERTATVPARATKRELEPSQGQESVEEWVPPTRRISTDQAEPSELPGEAPKKKRTFKFLRELPVLILIAFVLALLIKSFLVQAFYIPSESMDPTLKVGDRVLVEKVLKHPHRGWIVVFSNPVPGLEPHRSWLGAFWHWLGEGFGVSTPTNEDFIKRVIGLPGETVECRHGSVYIDGKKLNEPYLKSSIKAHGRDTRPCGPFHVPKGDVFVMGDNRPDSNDSRYGLGPIPIKDIIGRAFVVIWPPSHIRWLG